MKHVRAKDLRINKIYRYDHSRMLLKFVGTDNIVANFEHAGGPIQFLLCSDNYYGFTYDDNTYWEYHIFDNFKFGR